MTEPDLSPLDRHERIAFSWSGGKDSTAVLHLLRHELHRLTVYHVDTGDLLPEMREYVARFEAVIPNFVRINTNVAAWNIEHGLPTDLLPYSQHAIGKMMGEPKIKLVSRYDCCGTNLMTPLYQRVRADGCTLLIRGTKSIDMTQLPIASGEETGDGLEIFYPLQDWSHDDVFIYLLNNDVPVPRLYEHMVNAPECARCTAWWREGRGEYLARFYPELAQHYQARLRMVAAELGPSIDALGGELQAGL